VDFARIIQPMKHLDGYTDGEVTFKVDLFDIHSTKSLDWLQVAKKYDIIYLNYINDPWGYAAMGAMARKHGAKLVFDIDDSLWNVKDDNPAHGVYHKGSEAIGNFTSICNDVDYMTTTSDYLKHVIMNNTKKKATQIKVFPNYVDLDLYKYRAPFEKNSEITLMHFGSTTHQNDLSDDEFKKGIDRIFSEYPNIKLKMVGAFLPKFKTRWGQRYQNAYGHSDIYRWISDKFPEFMAEADILVVPLTDDIYNRCKSSIKFVESASAKIPGVWQDIRQYQEVIEPGKNGYLAKDAKDWYNGIKALIDDAEHRKSVGEAALKTVKDKWTIQAHVKDYAQFFKDILLP